ncbi:serine hydrolase domain-containing protein [Corynebacterium freiburgense]|uniref:serine hydrolase domain-containing protein n=1 Tax=Corynebacterium freiburgense TaxID=556548 RepID=UPI00040A40F6|nr:serine hydrolase domain-containing protein [Corynebacterium freiburgense]WJZ02986.1 D-alanyl-D-alanine carboxypeptidase precursor [Corynebacterium freiburgense]
MDETSLSRKLDQVFEAHTRKWQPQVAIRCPRLGIDYHYGYTDVPFHAASVGKLAAAALIMQLVERGNIALHTQVASILETKHLVGIFADNKIREVTIEQLLTHTSGANDYFLGRAKGLTIAKIAEKDPDRFWTPQELLAHSQQYQKPVGAPGKRFFYSDTGFLLLGLVLETITGAEYHELVHKRIFVPLEMNHSFMPKRSHPVHGIETIAPVYLGKTRADGTNAMTIDWAGGGIAATPDDFLVFLKALRTGTLVSKESWEWMRQPRNKFRTGLLYGAGSMTVEFQGLMPWLRGWPQLSGHLGSTAAHLWHDPIHDADITINYGSFAAMRPSFRALASTVGLLRKIEKSNL